MNEQTENHGRTLEFGHGFGDDDVERLVESLSDSGIKTSNIDIRHDRRTDE